MTPDIFTLTALESRLRELVELVASPRTDLSEWQLTLATNNVWTDAAPTRHRSFRIPVGLWSKVQHAFDVESQQPAYRAFDPLAVLGKISLSDVDNAEIAQAAQAYFNEWLGLCLALAAAALAEGDHKSLGRQLQSLQWKSFLDPGDWAPGNSLSTRPEPSQTDGSSEMYARMEPFLDLSTINALASLPVEMDWDVRVCLLLGLWAGARKSPRLPEEWALAEAWAAGTPRRMSSHDEMSWGRVWAMSPGSPLYGSENREATKDFTAWAYRRANSWGIFTSPDPEIHERLSQDASYGQETVGEAFPEWAKDAVGSGRVRKPVPRVIVQNAETTLATLRAELDGMEGLDAIKGEIAQIIALAKHQKKMSEQGLPVAPLELNMVFTGNPGTGKTTVARIYGQILKAVGLLPAGQFVEVTRADLVDVYAGGSALKVKGQLAKAEGGVLFIDEAYSLANDKGHGHGQESIDELVAGIEARRGNIALVVAGYQAPMGKFLGANPGLKSRFRDPVLFSDLPNSSLLSALLGMATAEGYELDEAAVSASLVRIKNLPRGQGFGNVRDVRKLFAVLKERLALRHDANPGGSLNVITKDDVPSVGAGVLDEARFESSMESLNSLVSVEPVKQFIGRLADQINFSRKLHDLGRPAPAVHVGHMAFVGNPGTGKTTVARLLGEVFASLGYLRSGHVVYANRSTLIGEYLGQTAPRVRNAVQEALDGVLFIDEAYALTAGHHNEYGVEAIATLLDEMEKYRERVVVVMAGYGDEMEAMLGSNPGLKSRVPNIIEFPNFSRADLAEIVREMVGSQGLRISEEAVTLMTDRLWARRTVKDFANARSVRNLVDRSVAKLASRAMRKDMTQLTSARLVTIEVGDVPMPDGPAPVAIGFAPNPV